MAHPRRSIMSAAGGLVLLFMFGFLFAGCGSGGKLTATTAFVDGAEFRANGRKGTITRVELGTITFPSGKATPKDTMMLDEEAPLDREVPREEGKATAAVAKFSDGDERVAFLRVRFRDGVAAKHELAKRLISEKWHESYREAYPVDSGYGGFVDYAAQRSVNKVLEDGSTSEARQMHEDLKGRWKNTWSWANAEILPGIRLLVISSGFGDGAFKTYYGLDNKGEILELVTDFDVL